METCYFMKLDADDYFYTEYKRINEKLAKIRATNQQVRVLSFFLLSPEKVLVKQDLPKLLYGASISDSKHSTRYASSKWRSSHQVMSRLRRLLQTNFSKDVPYGTEWLPYCAILGGWMLFRPPFGRLSTSDETPCLDSVS